MYEIFEELLKINKTTAYKVAQEAGVPYGSLTDWKSGRSTPASANLVKLADYFNVSIDYLMGRDKNFDPETKVQKVVKVITRKAEQYLTEEETEQLAEAYANSIEMFLKAKGIKENE